MSFSIISSKSPCVHSRTYVVATIAIAAMVLLGTMAANVLIDPQGVFGTRLFVPVVNPNLRYFDLQAYKAAPDRYDGALFGSSRGQIFDTELLAEYLGVHAVANFSVPSGLMTDHLPTLEYLLRDKAARRSHLTAIFLLLDADLFGREPWTNNNADSFLPPEIGGQSQWHFWWRYLTIFQFDTWRRYIDRNHSLARAPSHRAPSQHADERDGANPNQAQPRVRADLSRQLDLFNRFLALCRANTIKLVVAFSPLNRNNEDANDVQMRDNERIVDLIATRVPVWDFGRPEWLSQRPDLWSDVFHFKRSVADMMLQDIFTGHATAPGTFGELKMN